jgi:zinc protease
MTQISRLKRIFTTNIKAEDAGPRPEKLIPTTEFFDPALLILQVPKKTYNEFTNFSLAIRGFEKFLQDEISKNTTNLFSDVEIINFEETDGFIAFQFYDVKNSTELYKYIELKAKEFSKINYLSNAPKEFTLLKNYWITKEIPKTNSSENIAKKIYSSIRLNLPAQFYINQYEKISELTLEEYQDFFTAKIAEYFNNLEPYWIFSSDTKR